MYSYRIYQASTSGSGAIPKAAIRNHPACELRSAQIFSNEADAPRADWRNFERWERDRIKFVGGFT